MFIPGVNVIHLSFNMAAALADCSTHKEAWSRKRINGDVTAGVKGQSDLRLRQELPACTWAHLRAAIKRRVSASASKGMLPHLSFVNRSEKVITVSKH